MQPLFYYSHILQSGKKNILLQPNEVLKAILKNAFDQKKVLKIIQPQP